MTITEAIRPDRTLDNRTSNRTTNNRTTEPARTTRPPLVGPMALIAGVLMVVAQVVMLPFDPKDHVPTSQSVAFQAGGAVYLIGFCALMLALVGAYGWVARSAGRFGGVAVCTAVVGTMLLGGDLWFETFAVPSIADGPAAHQVLGSDPSVLLAIGAISSYLLFAIGWGLVGIATFRARMLPKAISIALVIGGVLGFNALLAPFGIPLGLAVAALGVWVLRQRKPAGARSGSR